MGEGRLGASTASGLRGSSPRWPTQLDKIKNLHAEFRSGPEIGALPPVSGGGTVGDAASIGGLLKKLEAEMPLRHRKHRSLLPSSWARVRHVPEALSRLRRFRNKDRNPPLVRF